MVELIILITLGLIGFGIYAKYLPKNKKQLKSKKINKYLPEKIQSNLIENKIESLKQNITINEFDTNSINNLNITISSLIKGLPLIIDLIRKSETDLNKIIHKDEYIYALINSLKAWKPRCGQEAIESDYHDSLERFLRKNCPHLKIERECFVDTKSENLRRRVDFLINKNLILEIKKNLNKITDVDRAYGQVFAYSQSMPVILIICETDENFHEKHGLNNKISELRNNGCSVVAIAAGRKNW